tara:strand:- start:2485 stop:3495 length:1011 start_codon:yes stop_codon:yes gene_type:complete
MIKFIVIFFVVFSWTFSKCEEGSGVTLMYHRFDDNRFPSTSISKDNFESQMLYLKKNNYTILPISKLVSFFEGNYKLPQKSIFITVDDGYKSFFKNGFPILKKLGFPFSIFLSTKFVSNEKNSDFMSWSMIKEVYNSNGSILNHTFSHANLNEISSEQALNELILAEEKIKNELNHIPKIFSYPYGESNNKIEKLLQKLGYKLAFSQHSSPISINENKYRLPRFSINDEFGKLERFKQIVSAKPFKFSNLTVSQKNLASGLLKFSFQIEQSTENINCYLNNNARLTIQKKEKKITVILNNIMKKKQYRLNCTKINENSELFWFGKMIITTNSSIIF